MKGPQVDQLVFDCMFPKPKSTEPQNFQQLLQRNLVPEVRLETQAFYGHLSSQEAKYPGLDYSYQPHRVRLSRYTWHRRLFRAFDNLGLTKSEIAGLTKWEGTRWAKERFEREQGIVIHDTTSDGIEDWVPPELRIPVAPQAQRADIEDMEDIQEDGEMEDNDNENENEMEEDGEESDTEITSVGVELNERLRAAVAQREAGNTTIPIDEEWEQWLKDAVEAGSLPWIPSASDLSPNAHVPGTRPATDSPAMHPRLLDAARGGQWDQIPDFLHNIVRQNIERRFESQATPSPPPPTTSTASRSVNLNSLARPAHRLPQGVPSPISPRTVARLDRSFAEAFSRRPIPPLPSSSTASSSRSTMRLSARVNVNHPEGTS